MASRRSLTKREREALYAMLETADALRTVFLQLRNLGWQSPHGLDDWDDGVEVIRALATDTESLVRSTA